MVKLNPKNLGLAGGIMWGASVFIITLFSVYTGYATDLINTVTSILPGYSISFSGAILGGLYGFVDAGIGCYILAWLYNHFEKR
jgi:hypothetical protein